MCENLIPIVFLSLSRMRFDTCCFLQINLLRRKINICNNFKISGAPLVTISNNVKISAYKRRLAKSVAAIYLNESFRQQTGMLRW